MRRASREHRKQEEGFALIMAQLVVAIVSSLVIGSLLFQAST
jgi:type II secretory pathway component PulK